VLKFALRRLLVAIPTLWVIVTLAFFIMRAAPGSPFDEEQAIAPEIKRNIEAAYGLDQPLYVQYQRYLSNVLRGDFGPSFKFKDLSVSEMIAQGAPASVILGSSAVLLSLILGVPLGIIAALRVNQTVDYLVRTVSLLSLALPGFLIGPLLILLFAIHLRWLPPAGWSAGRTSDMILPVVTLSLPLLAYIIRLTRNSLLEVLQMQYIRTARAKGLRERQVIVYHALQPTLLPVVSYLGPATAFVLTGSLVVESIYGIPGMGRFLVQGAINRDYSLVMGMVIVYALATLLCNLLADLLYARLNPRVSYG
jgi:oligopeptide transport system permease protein